MTAKRALIVDDSTTAQYRLKKMLQAYDLEIDSVDSGEAALLYLAKHVPDVVFMDHLMPGMDGFRALQIIKSHPETAMIPVIMYTSKSGDVYTGQARALGALDVISKDTISSVELSKVMSSIHIEPRTDQKNITDDAGKSASENDAALQANHASRTDTTAEISVQTVRQLISDNSRRIELRIVQLEHGIDDSRRVIAAQLIREMQKLRHHIKHEVTRMLGEHQQKLSTVPAIEPVKPEKTGNGKTLFVVITLLVVLIAFFVNYQRNVSQTLSAMSEQQNLQHQQLRGVETSLLNIQAEQIEQLQRAETAQASVATDEIPTINQWADFIWAFNQSSAMPFNPRLLDPTISVKLHEFVSRLSRQGFTGPLWFNLSVGNFCVVMDSAGQAQLPDHSARIAECMLYSELYPFESMVEQAITDINAALGSIEAVRNGEITIVMTENGNQQATYPQRESQLPASEWNKVAQANNQLTVAVRPPQTDERPVINEEILAQ